jgi:DNA repair exonuclease SbcCD ATPase subunit
MKLISLTLSQFKGITLFSLASDGSDVSVLGDNATGKTTLADAFFWLLFSKDSLGRADFSLKPLDDQGKEIRGTEPSVEASLMLEDGSKLTLKKVNQEKWQTKRGSLEREYQGTTTSYYINTVPVQKKDFDAKIESICSEKLFRILTDPTHFSEGLHWKDRREMLLRICGDVSVAEVCAEHPELEGLPEILAEHSIDEYRKINAATRATIKKEIESIPVRISEVQRQLDQMSAEAFDEKKAAQLDQALSTLLQKKATMSATTVKAQKFTALSNLKVQHSQIISRLKAEAGAGYELTLSTLRGYRASSIELQSQIDKKQNQITLGEQQVTTLKEEIDQLRSEWAEISHRSFIEPAQDGTCPVCLQALPAEDLATKRDEMLEAFNLQRAKDLEANSVSGRSKADLLKQREAQLTDARSEVASLQEKLEAVQLDLNVAAEAEADLRDPEIDQKHPELVSSDEKIKALEAEIEALGDDEQADLSVIDQEIKEARAQLEAENAKKATAQLRKTAENRLKLLKMDEKRLAEEHTALEARFYLTEQFIRAKVSALTSKINSHFTITTFKLFDEQVNGGLSECCEATCQGVPFSSLNNGRRVNVGLDIISTLSHHFGFKPPIFIDNAESVTSIIPTPGQQQIRLIVSASDQQLNLLTRKATAGVK